jgi:hypothetical protein
MSSTLWSDAYVLYYTCDEGEWGETSCTDGVINHALDAQVSDGVDDGQKGGRVLRLAAEVEGAQEAERARQQRPHRNRAPMHAGHWKAQVILHGLKVERTDSRYSISIWSPAERTLYLGVTRSRRSTTRWRPSASCRQPWATTMVYKTGKNRR